MNMYIDDNDMVQLRKAVNKINERLDKNIATINAELDEKIDYTAVKPTYFWAPRIYREEKAAGFTLYICGGDVLHLYVKENKLRCYIFDNTYDRYFEDAKLISTEEKIKKSGKNKGKAELIQKIDNPIRNKFNKITGRGLQFDSFKAYELLANDKIITDEDYCKIIRAFIRVVNEGPVIKSVKEGNKRPYERYRENYIAAINGDVNSRLQILDMEFAAPLNVSNGGKSEHGKSDLVGIMVDDDKKKIEVYFIEYKCTESATGGDDSLPEHYQAMHKYYKRSEILERVKAMYVNKMKLINKDWISPVNAENKLAYEDYETISQIWFLFSHVVTRVDNKKDIRVSESTIANKIISMMNPKEGDTEPYESSEVFFMVIKDFESSCVLDRSYIKKCNTIYKATQTQEVIKELL